MSKTRSTKTAASKTAKFFPTKLADILSKQVYATVADMDKDSANDPKFSPYTHESYSSIVAGDKEDGLKSPFTFGLDLKQYLVFLFKQVFTELENVELAPNDTIETLIEKLSDANFESYAAFMFSVGEKYKPEFGATLAECGDPTNWIHCQITGSIKKEYAHHIVLTAMMATSFDNFYKALAMLMTKYMYRTSGKAALTGQLAEGVLCIMGMKLSMLDEMVSSHVPTIIKKKEVKAAESTDATVGTTDVTSETPSETSTDVTSETVVTVETTTLNAGDIEDILNSI